MHLHIDLFIGCKSFLYLDPYCILPVLQITNTAFSFYSPNDAAVWSVLIDSFNDPDSRAQNVLLVGRGGPH